MNILLISPQMYPCVTGGMEVFNYYYIKELSSRGIKTIVLTFCENKFSEDIISLTLNKSLFGHFTLLLNLQIGYNILRLKKNIDFIHVPYTSNSPLIYPVLIINKLFKIPYVITIHGGGLHQWKKKKVHRLFFQFAQNIVAVSMPIKEEYEKRTCRVIKYIPPLIPFKIAEDHSDKLRIKYNYLPSDTIILCLGSIKKIKGNDILLKAFLALGEAYIKKSNLKLLYVGDGPMKSILEQNVNTTNMSSYIKFLGKIPHNKVSEIYHITNIYVIPSHFEGAPISMLEAMYNSLPIIGTDVDGINSLISHGKNGLLFAKDDVNDLKKQIKSLVENKALCHELGLAANNSYRNGITFDDVINSHIALYENTIGVL